MNTSNFIRLFVRDLPNVLQTDYSMQNDAIFRAVRQMQEETFCSRIRATQAVAVSDYDLAVYPIFYGTDYATATKNKFNVIPIRIEGVWVQESDGELNPVYLDGSREVQNTKDTYDADDDIYEYQGTIDIEGESVILRTSFDMNGLTLQFWMSYQIPYIADAFYSNVTLGSDSDCNIKNSLLETIPLRFRDRLLSGAKYQLYKSMFEKTNTAEYQALMQTYGEEWLNKDLPRVRQECNRNIATETVSQHKVKPVFGIT